jgi:hypothetical protein
MSGKIIRKQNTTTEGKGVANMINFETRRRYTSSNPNYKKICEDLKKRYKNPSHIDYLAVDFASKLDEFISKQSDPIDSHLRLAYELMVYVINLLDAEIRQYEQKFIS